MSYMFALATGFSGDISHWNVSNVTNMAYMFNYAHSFSNIGTIAGWNVGNVTNMEGMFFEIYGFNQNIGNWNVGNVTNMADMFYKNYSFNQNIGSWNVSNVTNTSGMFNEAHSFNQNIGNWNVSQVIDMSDMFNFALAFNQDIGGWNVGNVTNMSNMFNMAKAFNINISAWNVSNVENMESMFYEANNFNQPIGRWNVVNVNTMESMFYNVNYFNQDLDLWDVSNVTNMHKMFNETSNFNKNISSWDVGSVTDMGFMFRNAYGFNQNIGSWDVSNVTNMTDMFFNCNQLSTRNYDAILMGWNTRALQLGVTLNAPSTYCAAEAARANMTDTYGWIITDGGKNCETSYFITTWETTMTDEYISIPTDFSFIYDYTIDWGDGGPTQIANGQAYHSYSNPGIYTVKILGDFPKIKFQHNYGYAPKLKTIEQWGNIAWESMAGAFFRCENLVINATDAPDLSRVISMQSMFYSATSMNQDIGHWDVSNVTIMGAVFQAATSFNQDIGNWDVSNVTNMIGMFSNNFVFNQNIGGWDVSNVTTMQHMFENLVNFNHDISGWNVGNVTDMGWMFNTTGSFNQDISSWDVANVTDMRHMFKSATSFNQDISSWDVANVTDMRLMFNGATSFDEDLGEWNVSNLTNAADMFKEATLSTANYDALLIGWAAQTRKPNVTFSGGNATYCTGQDARNAMTTDIDGWTITDAGRNCAACGPITKYTASGWSNGAPDTSMMAVFAIDYNTNIGNIEACGIEILPGVTVTVSAGTTIQAENNIIIDGDLIFISSDTGNGELAAMGAASAIIGEATVQRYMSDQRAYRMVSPAVTTNSSIHANWQEGGASPAGFGTHITGSQTGQNGFDATGTGASSMYTVDVSNQSFVAIANTNVNTLTAGIPYLMMVRGDRNIDLTNNTAHNATTLRATGYLANGDITQNFPVGNGTRNFVMFGNPYQSAVDVNSVLGNTGSLGVISSRYIVYDPTIADHGGYVTVDFLIGNSVPSSANQYLQPGQAAQAEVTGPSTVVFQETNKAPGNYTQTNRNSMSENDMLSVQLYTSENLNNGGPAHDGFVMLFAEDFDNGLTLDDAIKPMNFYENFGINQGETYLNIERREMPVPEEVYPLYSSGYAHSEYTLKLIIDGLEETFLYLDDTFTSTTTLLGAGDTTYSLVSMPTIR